jgi:hypothetical protein
MSLDIKVNDGRREAWLVYMGVGGYVCAEPDADKPDGICGMPVESEPCDIHHPDTTEPYVLAPASHPHWAKHVYGCGGGRQCKCVIDDQVTGGTRG